MASRYGCAVLVTVWSLAVASGLSYAQESPYLYGIHDHEPDPQEYLDHLRNAGVSGWVTATAAIGSNPNETDGGDFRWLADQGFTVIVRLIHGSFPNGSIPQPSQYHDFARRAANYVAASRGADHFVIGHETNLAREWPLRKGGLRYVSPQDYARCFRLAYDAINAVRPQARVLSQALAPFAGPYPAGSNEGYPHAANPLNWVQYLHQMLSAIRNSGGIDGMALHLSSRGYRREDIHSQKKITANGQLLYSSFYVYQDWVQLGIPRELYHLPLYATQVDGTDDWSGGKQEKSEAHYQRGWLQEVYAEIRRYNRAAAAAGTPLFRCLNLFRWCAWCGGWNIDASPYKGDILADLDEAVSFRFRSASGCEASVDTSSWKGEYFCQPVAFG